MELNFSVHSKKVFFVFNFIGILLLIYICLNNYNYADDYGHKVIAEQKSLSVFFDNLYYYYQTHLGRAFSFNVIFTWFVAGAFPVQLVTLFWLFIHLVNCLLIYLIVFNNKRLKYNDFLIIGLLLLFSWVGMKTHIGYNVFWATGGYMALSGMFALYIVYLVLFKLKSNTLIGHFGRSLLFLNVGMLAENMALAFGSWFILFVIWKYYKTKRFDKILILYFIFYLIGFLIVFLSPGTQQRMLDENATFSAKIIIYNFIYLVGFYLFINKVLIFFMISLGFFIYYNSNRDFIFSKSKEVLFYLILLSLLVTLPFSAMPSMSFVKRAGYFFSFFIAGSGLYIGLFIGKIISTRFSNQILKAISTLSIIVCLGYVFFNFYIQIPLFLDVKKQMDHREEILIKSKESGLLEVEIPIIYKNEKLYTGRVLELSPNPDFLENTRMAEYFGLNKVWVKSEYVEDSN